MNPTFVLVATVVIMFCHGMSRRATRKRFFFEDLDDPYNAKRWVKIGRWCRSVLWIVSIALLGYAVVAKFFPFLLQWQ